jgi:hypothetical protein
LQTTGGKTAEVTVLRLRQAFWLADDVVCLCLFFIPKRELILKF